MKIEDIAKYTLINNQILYNECGTYIPNMICKHFIKSIGKQRYYKIKESISVSMHSYHELLCLEFHVSI